MNYEAYTTQDVSTVFNTLHTNASGLSAQEAVKRQKEYGLNNVLLHKRSVLTIFIDQLRSYLVILLLGAVLLSVAVAEYTQALLILFFLVINTCLGFYQEYKSEKVVQLLKKYLKLSARVRRNGQIQTIDAQQLVPGDIVALEAGDRIPADIRFIEASEATVDESVLTGESMPVSKETKAISHTTDISKASNIGFCGTVLATGTAAGVVVATGNATVVGDISAFITTISRESSFFQDIKKLSKFIFWFVIVTMLGIFLIHVVTRGVDASVIQLLSFSIALAVAVTPEVMPTVIAFALSRGAMALAEQKVVVKRLSAIEDLGNIDILCTDKTGTLTENILTLQDIISRDPERAVLYSLYASSTFFTEDQKNSSLNAFDLAIKNKLSAESLEKSKLVKKIATLPFTPERLRTSVVIEEGHKKILIVRGAEESVLGRTIDLKDKDVVASVEDHRKKGDRVIVIAYKELGPTSNIEADLKDEKELTVLGFLIFIDPIKKDVAHVIERLRALKVDIKILTGDAPEVAQQVGQAVHILQEGEKVITGYDFEKLPRNKQEEAVNHYKIFARVTPLQKYTIVKLLQERYRVGYLGDGINDAPVLKQADVGIVVQQAIDVARESADVILLKKSLKSVVEAIYQGRLAVNNIAKYIKTTLSANFGNLYSLALSSLFLDYLPMLPIQLLLANVLSDVPMLAISTDTVDINEMEKPKRFSIKELFLFTTVFGIITVPFDIMLLVHFRFSPTLLRTAWFVESVFTELMVICSLRSKKVFFRAQRPSWWLSGLLILTTFITFFVTLVTPFREFFKFIILPWSVIIFIIVLCLVYFLAVEGVKRLYYHFIGYK